LGAGIGVLLVLLSVVAGAAYLSLGDANENFTEYRKLARRTVTAALWDSDLLTARVGVKTFLIEQTPESAQATLDALSAFKADIGKYAEVFKGTDGEKVATEVAGHADKYEAGFKEVLELKKQRDPQVAIMNDLGPKIEKNLTAVMQQANSQGNAAVTYAAGETLRNVLLARVYAMKFLKDNQQEQVDQVRKEMTEYQADVTALAETLKTAPELEKLAQEAVSMGKAYTDAFEQVQGLIFKRNDVINDSLNKVGPMIAKATGGLADAAKAAQDALGPKAAAEIQRGIVTALTISGIAILFGIGIGFLVARGITRPIIAMTHAMGSLAEGKFETEVPAQDQKDEVGAMAAAVQVFKLNMIRNKEMQEREAAELEARAKRAQAIAALTEAFDKQSTAVVKTVSSAATEMQATASSMSATAEETARQATTVAAASEQASTNVQTVASATEELTASISEITSQVSESTRIVSVAVEQASETNEKVKGLSEAAQKIGDVVRLINDIAGQTNLLALNATIEAARAGEAGKGFAVVASEVKTLATQTAKATEEISGQIRAIQDATASSAESIENISKTIARVSEISTAIASAVEEQGAATQEIARNVQQAAIGTQEVSTNIVSVTEAAQHTGTAATQLLGASGDLAKQAEVLKMEVERYIEGVKAA
jgi:methyl-accepting chemotaxis protein